MNANTWKKCDNFYKEPFYQLLTLFQFYHIDVYLLILTHPGNLHQGVPMSFWQLLQANQSFPTISNLTLFHQALGSAKSIHRHLHLREVIFYFEIKRTTNCSINLALDGCNHPKKDLYIWEIFYRFSESSHCFSHSECPQPLKCVNGYCGQQDYLEVLSCFQANSFQEVFLYVGCLKCTVR